MEKIFKGLVCLENIIAGLVCLVIGIFLIIVTVNTFIDEKEFNEVAVEVTGKIVDVEVKNKYTTARISPKASISKTRRFVYASYEYEGKKYEHIELSAVVKTVYEGDIVQIYIDPENPTDARLATFTSATALGSGFAVLFLICSICSFKSIKEKEKPKKKKKLLFRTLSKLIKI
ncbi:MAG: DUF3592 domain-containing protein [Acutalibacteraceae bacterium]|nr:DUF3592 domain-containing protein [Acutalibacteraceae bacterium]